jgi:hypothetical protein
MSAASRILAGATLAVALIGTTNVPASAEEAGCTKTTTETTISPDGTVKIVRTEEPVKCPS